MDGRRNNGGARPGAGRLPKGDELKLIESLKEFDDIARECMLNGIKDGNYAFWNKFMEYRWGKPKERVDVTTNGESIGIPLIDWIGED